MPDPAADRLRALVEPAGTAVLTMELQRGVVGDQALLPALRDEVTRTGALDAAGRLCHAARRHGVRVVHCTAETRADGAGAAENNKLLALAAKARRAGQNPIEAGSPGAEVVAELGVDPADIVVARIHGLTPFTSTSLDQILRNLGVGTIVVTGVSLNVGVPGLVLSAADLGYQVVVATDAVAGVPADYGRAVVANTLSFLATLATVDEITASWEDRT